MREDEVASNAMGINTTRVKVTAFVIGFGICRNGGCGLWADGGLYQSGVLHHGRQLHHSHYGRLGGHRFYHRFCVSRCTPVFLPEKLRDVKAIPVSGVLAGLVAVVATVWVIKDISEHVHRDRNTKARMVFGSILGSIGLTLLLSLLLKGVPSIGAQTIDGSKMRMVIFAVTLVVLMLLRPQGVFAHHEFSWNWLKGLLNRKKGGKIEAGGQA